MTGSSNTPVGAFRRSIRSLLAGLVAKDPCSHGQAERVAQLVVSIASEFGLDQARIQRLVLAAHLHDVGKVSIPDPILLKQGPLTPPEYEIVKRHSLSGSRLVAAAGLHEIARWIRSHHERWDGSGYPDGLAGEKIPIEARILAVADALDAMTTARAYRTPISALEAAAELDSCAGHQFDPEIAGWVAAALRNGELGLVKDPLAGAAALQAELSPLLSSS